MLGQDRQLERAVARAGILEVDEPDPAAVPQVVGQVRVTMSQDGVVTGAGASPGANLASNDKAVHSRTGSPW